MRRRLALVSAAVTAMVVLAFVVPLAGLVRSLARDRVLVTAEREAQTQAQALSVVLPEAGVEGARLLVGAGSLSDDQLLTVALPDGSMLGAEVPFDDGFARAADGEAFRQPESGGEAIFVPVFLAEEPSAAVVRVFVPQEELTRNVGAAWVSWLGWGLPWWGWPPWLPIGWPVQSWNRFRSCRPLPTEWVRVSWISPSNPPDRPKSLRWPTLLTDWDRVFET